MKICILKEKHGSSEKGCSPGFRTLCFDRWLVYSCAGAVVILILDLIIVVVDDGNASQIHQITKILIPGHFTTLFVSNLSFLTVRSIRAPTLAPVCLARPRPRTLGLTAAPLAPRALENPFASAAKGARAPTPAPLPSYDVYT